MAVGLALAGCGRRETAVDAGLRTQTLHWNIHGETRDFDPHTTTLTMDSIVIQTLLEGLTNIDPKTAAPIPGAAQRWDVSPDGLHWTFFLRPNARWSNGDPVTAHDFVYAYRRILSPALGAEYRDQFHVLRNAAEFTAGQVTDFGAVGVRAKDDLTLKLELTRPVPYLPSLVAQISGCDGGPHRGRTPPPLPRPRRRRRNRHPLGCWCHVVVTQTFLSVVSGSRGVTPRNPVSANIWSFLPGCRP